MIAESPTVEVSLWQDAINILGMRQEGCSRQVGDRKRVEVIALGASDLLM